MSFSYNSSLGSDLYVVRFLVQDTLSPGDLQDEEITYLLTVHGSPEGAALAAARSVYARYARQVNKAVGDLRLSYSDRAKAWREVLDQLVAQADSTNPRTIYVGGVERADRVADDEDPDLEQPTFEVGMHDFPLVEPIGGLNWWDL